MTSWLAGMPIGGMRSSIILAVALGLSTQPSTARGNDPQRDAASQPGFSIRIPPGISPESARVFYALAPSGRLAESLKTRAGVSDYAVPLSGARYLKLLIMMPGYQTVTAEFRDAQLDSTTAYTPPLTPLPTVPLAGRLLDSSNRPVSNHPLALSYVLMETVQYFCGSCMVDGNIPEIEFAARTDAAGAFTVALPNLPADPFFQRYSTSTSATFFVSTMPRSLDTILRNSKFSLQATADRKPLLITLFAPGALGGRLGGGFLREQGIPDLTSYRLDMGISESSHPDLRPRLVLWADSIDRPNSLLSENGMTGPDGVVGRVATLNADGTFEVSLPAGRYDLNLVVMGSPGDTLQRKIPVATGVSVLEGQRFVIDRP